VGLPGLLGLAAAVVAVLIVGAPAASGNYAVTAWCTSGGQTSACQTGWYTGDVWLAWTWNPPDGNATSGCVPHSYTHDTVGFSSCAVDGLSGGPTATTQPIHVEVSLPTVLGLPTRRPDHDGWYNHPVGVAFGGSSFSGIARCTRGTYAGPASPAATVIGSCTDNAGKTAPGIASLQYDATPPALTVTTSTGDGSVEVRLSSVRDVAPISSVKVTRRPGLGRRRSSVLERGNSFAIHDGRARNGVRYRYTIAVRDRAGNVAVRTLAIVPGPHLLSPATGAVLTAPPLLSWTPVRGASYYNVQLYRNGRVLNAWPTRPALQLGAVWSFAGRRYRLKPGRYRWYAWPGFGAPNAARYGALIGSGSFVIRRPR
jgi:hypothetical protein